MVLYADEPRMVLHFDHFDQIGVRIDADRFQAGPNELVEVVVVELVAVAMTLDDVLAAVCRIGLRSFLEGARIASQTHRASFLGNSLLLLHQVDDRMRGAGHFGRVGVFVAQHVTGELDHAALHAETDAEKRDFLFAGVPYGQYFALDAPVSEPRSHQNAAHALEL